MEIMFKANKLWGIDKTKVKPNEAEIVATTTFIKKENQVHIYSFRVCPIVS
jgi:hypothetical protein